MQREIKFRAWDKELKQWWYSQELDAEFLGEILQGKYPEMIVCQYTGLTDKNNKEIYEGDIVQVFPIGWDENESMLQRMSRKTVVEWEEFEDGEYGYRLGFGFNISWEKEEKVKIIGNIYENPELLNK